MVQILVGSVSILNQAHISSTIPYVHLTQSSLEFSVLTNEAVSRQKY